MTMRLRTRVTVLPCAIVAAALALVAGAAVACSAILDTDKLDRARCDQPSDCQLGDSCDPVTHICRSPADASDASPADATVEGGATLPDGGAGQLPFSDWQYELTGGGSPVLTATAFDPYGNILVIGASDAAVVGQNDDFGGGAAQSIQAGTYPQLFFSGLSGDGQNLVFNQHISADTAGPRAPMNVFAGTLADGGDDLLAVMLVPDPPASVEVVGFLYDAGGYNGTLTTDPVRERITLADAGLDAGDGGFPSTLTFTAGQRLQNGTLYLAGYFSGALAVGAKTLHSVVSTTGLPSQDGLLVRIDPASGDMRTWVFSTAYDDQLTALCDVDENVGIAGTFASSDALGVALDLDGAPITGVTSQGKEDGFFAVFDDTALMVTVAGDVGGANTDVLRAITYLPGANELVVGGRAQMPITIGEHAFAQGNQNEFVLLAAFDATAGTATWSQLFPYGSNDTPTITTLVPAPGNGDVLVGGQFSSLLDLGTGPLSSTSRAGFLGRLSADGGAKWAATLGTSVQQLLVDADGGLLATGTFGRTLALGGDASFDASQVPASGATIFLAHFPSP